MEDIEQHESGEGRRAGVDDQLVGRREHARGVAAERGGSEDVAADRAESIVVDLEGAEVAADQMERDRGGQHRGQPDGVRKCECQCGHEKEVVDRAHDRMQRGFGERPARVGQASEPHLGAVEQDQSGDYADRFALEQSSEVADDGVFFAPTSELERMYRGRPPADDGRSLRQFGYGFFAADPARPGAAAPLAAVDPGHVLAPGDEVIVTLSGSVEGRHELTIDVEGAIALPGVGSVLVAGRRYDELRDVIRSAVTERGRRRAFEVDVSIGKLRPFRVQVVGHVATPGAIEVPGRATVLTALERAGGPRPSGSLRRVELRRDGEAIAQFDLYAFLIEGDVTGMQILRPDDVLVVPPIGATVGVAGAVHRPAIYELGADATIGAVLELAGGLTPFAYTDAVQVERSVDGRRETMRCGSIPPVSTSH